MFSIDSAPIIVTDKMISDNKNGLAVEFRNAKIDSIYQDSENPSAVLVIGEINFPELTFIVALISKSTGIWTILIETPDIEIAYRVFFDYMHD